MANLPCFTTVLAPSYWRGLIIFVRKGNPLKVTQFSSVTRLLTAGAIAQTLSILTTVLGDNQDAFAEHAKSFVMVSESYSEHPKPSVEYSFSLGGYTLKRGDYSKTFCMPSATSVTCYESSVELNQTFCMNRKTMGIHSEVFVSQCNVSVINNCCVRHAYDAAAAHFITKS